jgi:hypothetical protein
MLELFTTDEFASWFGGLDDRDAEEVAGAIEVLALRAEDRSSEAGSPLLLWYENPQAPDAQWVRSLDDYAEFFAYAQALIRCLDSPSVKARQQRLSGLDARRFDAARATVQACASPLTALRMHARTYAGRSIMTELRRAYADMVAVLGADLAWPKFEAGLRELQLCERSPRIRILYGVDHAKERGLLVLGERLEGSFYGESVRRALRAWERFSAGSGHEYAAYNPGQAR